MLIAKIVTPVMTAIVVLTVEKIAIIVIHVLFVPHVNHVSLAADVAHARAVKPVLSAVTVKSV